MLAVLGGQAWCSWAQPTGGQSTPKAPQDGNSAPREPVLYTKLSPRNKVPLRDCLVRHQALPHLVPPHPSSGQADAP